jgi:hypothetical protein
MTENGTDVHTLGRRLVGSWTAESTHPAFPGTVVAGTADVEWLEGERFILFRSRSEHPEFPDSLSVLGDFGGLQWQYYDSRGIHRVYDLAVTADGWEVSGDVGDFEQRLSVRFAEDDNAMIGTSQISVDRVTWTDDLAITYRRA